MIDLKSHRLRPGHQHRPRPVATSPARCSGSAEGRGPDPAQPLLPHRPGLAPGSSSCRATSTSSTAVGWEVADHRALQEAREHLAKAGVEFEEGTPEELAERRVQEMIRFRDPWDNVFELFHGITYEARPVVTPYAATLRHRRPGDGPHRAARGSTTSRRCEFYTDVLGFRLRDSMSMPGEFVGKEPGTKVWLRFFGINPRHHSLAFLPMPNPSKCVHIMLEVDRLDDVGRALERVRKHKAPLSATLGRHMNDEMISFYVRSPGGFDIEFGTEGLHRRRRSSWVARESHGGLLLGPRLRRRAAVTDSRVCARQRHPGGDEPRRARDLAEPRADRVVPRRRLRLRVRPGETIPSTPRPEAAARPAGSATCSAGSRPASPW